MYGCLWTLLSLPHPYPHSTLTNFPWRNGILTNVKIKRESVLNALLLFSFIAVLVYTGYTTYLVSFIHLFGFALVRCPLGEGALEAFIGVLIIIVMGWYVIKWIGRTYID